MVRAYLSRQDATQVPREGVFAASITAVELIVAGEGPRALPRWRVRAAVREAATGQAWEAGADIPLTPPFTRLRHLLAATDAPIDTTRLNAYADGARIVGLPCRVRVRSVPGQAVQGAWVSEIVQFHAPDDPDDAMKASGPLSW